MKKRFHVGTVDHQDLLSKNSCFSLRACDLFAHLFTLQGTTLTPSKHPEYFHYFITIVTLPFTVQKCRNYSASISLTIYTDLIFYVPSSYRFPVLWVYASLICPLNFLPFLAHVQAFVWRWHGSKDTADFQLQYMTCFPRDYIQLLLKFTITFSILERAFCHQPDGSRHETVHWESQNRNFSHSTSSRNFNIGSSWHFSVIDEE